MALESKIHELQGSILGVFYLDEDVIIRILLEIKFLPKLAFKVEPTIDKELESRSSNCFSLVFNASIFFFLLMVENEGVLEVDP